MSQAFYSAISGITAAQQKIDVIADNVANMNTIAFKESQLQFQTVMSKTLSVGGAPSDGIGGQNPTQIGLGVQVANISKNFSNGTVQYTGKSSDLTIEGNGYFTVKDSAGETFLTRAGNFTPDSSGYLVTSSGEIVLGTDSEYSNTNGNTYIKIPQSLTLHTDGNTAVGVKPLSGLNAIDQINKGVFSIDISDSGAGASVSVDISAGAINSIDAVITQMNNALTAAGYTDIVASTGTGDDAGKLQLSVDTTGPNGVTNITMSSATDCNFPSATGLSSPASDDGSPTEVYSSAVLDYTATVNPPGATSMSNTGYIIDGNGKIEATYSNGDKLTVESSGGSRRLVYITAEGVRIKQDYITVNGGVIDPANLQLQLASVVNENGLVSEGSNRFSIGPNAGDLTYSVPVSNGYGSIQSGYLESSNVDLPTQFAEMIMTQRNIEANSRTFDTVNQVLQQIVNLGR